MNESKKKILEKSFNLFLTKSFNTATMQEIQETVGLSRGAIYYHFSSKEEIYSEIINQYLLPVFSNYLLIPEEQKNTLLNAINASVKYRQEHLNKLKEIVPSKLIDYYFFKFLFDATEHSSKFKEQINSLINKELSGWKNIITTAIRTGEIRSDIDIDYISRYFIWAPIGSGIFSALNNEINIHSLDNRTTYIQFYNLLKKSSFI